MTIDGLVELISVGLLPMQNNIIIFIMVYMYPNFIVTSDCTSISSSWPSSQLKFELQNRKRIASSQEPFDCVGIKVKPICGHIEIAIAQDLPNRAAVADLPSIPT